MNSDLVGRRVRLVHCDDEYTRLAPGALGTITLVDSLGTLHVKWDDGHSLGLVPGHDHWEMLRPAGTDERGATVLRAETDACERGTVGCSVVHTAGRLESCETW